MSRLYDGLITPSQKEIPGLSDTTVIVADNVAQYWMDNIDRDTSVDHLTELCLAPVYDNLFVEARFRNKHNFCYAGAVLLYYFDAQEPEIQNGFGHRQDIADVSKAKWLLFGQAFAQITEKSEPFLTGFNFWFFLDELGYSLSKRNEWVGNRNPNSYVSDDYMAYNVSTLCRPLMAALAFMNCKNIELINEVPPPKLSAKHEKRYGQPLVTYKTIKVNPMRTAKHYTDLDTQAAPHEPQPSNAPLHIARGHFKDYRDGKGLFGKLRGVYWWDQHVRGNIENGAVIKDYDVQAPKGKTP